MPSLEVELDLGVALVLPPSRYLRLSQVVVESGDGTGGAYYTLRVVREDHFVLGLAALEVGGAGTQGLGQASKWGRVCADGWCDGVAC